MEGVVVIIVIEGRKSWSIVLTYGPVGLLAQIKNIMKKSFSTVWSRAREAARVSTASSSTASPGLPLHISRSQRPLLQPDSSLSSSRSLATSSSRRAAQTLSVSEPRSPARSAGDRSNVNGPLLAAVLSALGAAVGISASRNPARCESQLVRSHTVEVGERDEFREGDRREIDVSEQGVVGVDKILLHFMEGKFFCTAANCTCKVPLKFGFGNKKTVTCPAHDAAFDLSTGRAVRGPRLDPLATYPVSVKNGRIYITLKREDKVPTPAARDPKNEEVICIIGSGAAGWVFITIFITQELFCPKTTSHD